MEQEEQEEQEQEQEEQEQEREQERVRKMCIPLKWMNRWTQYCGLDGVAIRSWNGMRLSEMQKERERERDR